MRQAVDKTRVIKIVDPNREPLQVIDQVTFHRWSDSCVDMTFCTATPVISEACEFSYEAVVTAHLRFDVRLARAIVEGLVMQIARVDAARRDAVAPQVPESDRIVN